MYEIECKIDGLVPIMFSRFPLPTKPGDKTKKKPQTVKDKMWIDKKGVYIPTDNLRMLLIGNRFRTGAAKIQGTVFESKKGTQYLDFCKACVYVRGIVHPLKVYFKPKRTKEDETDIRSFVTATPHGGRDTTERPLLLTPWSLTFHIDVTEDTLSPEQIKKFYDCAGMRCGLGVYGPTFGRFIVSEWKVVKEKKRAS